MERVGGQIFVSVNGQRMRAKGNYTYHLGTPKRDVIVGSDGPHGFKEMPQAAYIEGEITDSGTFDMAALMNTTNATVSIDLANGKTAVFSQAAYTGDGTVQTEEGNAKFRFDALSAKEIQ